MMLLRRDHSVHDLVSCVNNDTENVRSRRLRQADACTLSHWSAKVYTGRCASFQLKREACIATVRTRSVHKERTINTAWACIATDERYALILLGGGKERRVNEVRTSVSSPSTSTTFAPRRSEHTRLSACAAVDTTSSSPPRSTSTTSVGRHLVSCGLSTSLNVPSSFSPVRASVLGLIFITPQCWSGMCCRVTQSRCYNMNIMAAMLVWDVLPCHTKQVLQHEYNGRNVGRRCVAVSHKAGVTT
jgi:hypothetical protein